MVQHYSTNSHVKISVAQLLFHSVQPKPGFGIGNGKSNFSIRIRAEFFFPETESFNFKFFSCFPLLSWGHEFLKMRNNQELQK